MWYQRNVLYSLDYVGRWSKFQQVYNIFSSTALGVGKSVCLLVCSNFCQDQMISKANM